MEKLNKEQLIKLVKIIINVEGKEDEIDVNDVCRMIRQEVLPQIAVKKSIQLLKENPLAGEVYDGQLIEVLYSIYTEKYREYAD